MSTHNIGFYEDLTQIIFELSSNIIKYTPYYHTVQPDSFSTVGAFSTVATVLDES